MNLSLIKTYNQLWSRLIIEELIRYGHCFFCISPGSRSTPLALAVAGCESAQAEVFPDERGAAFHALGYARAAGRPAVLICTSGTAGANYYPAVVEASMDNLPMIILTADRPPELQSAGANQTIRQEALFGDYVRWRHTLPCPCESVPPKYILTTVDQAVHRSLGHPAGPVHLNLMYREPLMPVRKEVKKEYAAGLKNWLVSRRPFTRYANSRVTCSKADFDSLRKLCRGKKRGLLAVGRLTGPQNREAVRTFAEKLGWPAWGDIQSGIRLGAGAPPFMPCFDHLLLNAKFTDNFQPDVIVHLGGGFVSKRWLDFAAQLRTTYIHVTDSPERLDPARCITERLVCDIPIFCGKFIKGSFKPPESLLLDLCGPWNTAAEKALNSAVPTTGKITEPGLARFLSMRLDKDSGLFLGSSMPVRDMDWYARPGFHNLYTAANRGASGIDGSIASAAGLARGGRLPVLLITGDLGFLHDLNSLHMLKALPYPVLVVVVNNGGGGIFSLLPVAGKKDVFEKYFAAAHDLSFGGCARTFGLDYYSPLTFEQLETNLHTAMGKMESALIEVRTNRAENEALHRKIFKVFQNL